MPGMLISAAPIWRRAGVGVLGVLGHLDRGLEAALGHHQLGHLAGQVHVGRADVAVRVGERVVGSWTSRPSGSLSAMPATSTPPLGRRAATTTICAWKASWLGAGDGVDVGDVVGERVQPGLVHAQAGAGDAQHVEGAHHGHRPRCGRGRSGRSTARVISWYWNCVCIAASVSLRRSTLLPLAPTGVSVGESWSRRRGRVARGDRGAQGRLEVDARGPEVRGVDVGDVVGDDALAQGETVEGRVSAAPTHPGRPKDRPEMDTAGLRVGRGVPIRRRGESDPCSPAPFGPTRDRPERF